MKTTVQWLKQWCDLTSEQIIKLSEVLTHRGLEVESIEPVCKPFTEVYVGRVIQCEQHPNADKLSLCTVDVGESEPLQIICGASNVRANLNVAVAKVGAELPGIKIKKAKLRGVASHGMLCSASELGLAEQSSVIMALPDDAPIGTLFYQYYNLDDHVLDISITPNRGDCISTLGIARELALAANTTINPQLLAYQATEISTENSFEIDVNIQQDLAKACPEYCARVISGIDNTRPTPIWMQEYLRRAGLRSVNLIVDITNYVMLDLGQPLHAFDHGTIEGPISVAMADTNTAITLLDNTELNLDHQALIITDQAKPLALAGIMGALNTGVTEQSTTVVLESAYFNPEVIARTARHYRLHSDACYRFERGVDPTHQLLALERASQLIVELVGGSAGKISQITHEDALPKAKPIILSVTQLNHLLGTELSGTEVVNLLSQLAMQCEISTDAGTSSAQVISVIPPLYRHDITIAEDVIEEVLRLIGCDAIEPVAPIKNNKPISIHTDNRAIDLTEARHLLQHQGFQEIISYSFVDPKLVKQCDPAANCLALVNPISRDLSTMRTNLWPGLLSTAIYNSKRQQARIKLFEHGLVFNKIAEGKIEQCLKLAGLGFGSAWPEQWGSTTRSIDFFDMKHTVEQLLSQIVPITSMTQFTFIRKAHPALHPGQSAAIYHADYLVGYIGVLHPNITQQHKLASAPVLFELDYQYLARQKVERVTYQPLSKFPEVRRDIAVLVDKAVPVQALIDAIDQLNEPKLLSIQLFDQYLGVGIPDDKKSLALALIFQDKSATLVDEDVALLLKKVIDLLEGQFDAVLRE